MSVVIEYDDDEIQELIECYHDRIRGLESREVDALAEIAQRQQQDREIIKALEENKKLQGCVIKDCIQLIKQLRPDCYDAGVTLAGMLRDVIGKEAPAILEAHDPRMPQIPGILSIYQVLCLEGSPCVYVLYDEKDGEVKRYKGRISQVGNGQVVFKEGFHILLKTIQRMGVINEQDESQDND